MCLGIPGRVVEVVPGYADQLALVDVVGAQRRVNVGMLDKPPSPGDWLLIHMGFALEIIDAAQAEQAMEGLELMGQARSDGPRADQPSTNSPEPMRNDTDETPANPAPTGPARAGSGGGSWCPASSRGCSVARPVGEWPRPRASTGGSPTAPTAASKCASRARRPR